MAKENNWGLWQYALSGVGFILLAFFAGSQQNVTFSFLGFLSFFVIGMTLIIEGFKRRKGKKGS